MCMPLATTDWGECRWMEARPCMGRSCQLTLPWAQKSWLQPQVAACKYSALEMEGRAAIGVIKESFRDLELGSQHFILMVDSCFAAGRAAPSKRKAWRASHEGEGLENSVEPIDIGARARRRQTRRPDRYLPSVRSGGQTCSHSSQITSAKQLNSSPHIFCPRICRC